MLPMRIGMVTACYTPVVNGVTRVISQYRAALEAAGHEVTVFTLGGPKQLSSEAGVVRSQGLAIGDTGYTFNLRYNRIAQQAMSQLDIIHCHHLLMGLEFAHRYGRGPIVFTNHTRYDLYLSAYGGLPQAAADVILRRLWPIMTRYCDVVVAPSASIAGVLKSFGVRAPIEVIHNGIDLTRYQQPVRPVSRGALEIPDEATLFIYVGRLSSEKNVTRLIEQFALAAHKSSAIHLLILGQGPLRAKVLHEARQCGIARQVHLAGLVPFECVASYLAAADIYVTASTSEVHPLSVIEALAAGLPIVAVNAPGILDLVEHGIHGLLAEHDEGLAACMLELVENPAKRQRMAQTAKREGLRYDINNTVRHTLALYHQLCSRQIDGHRQDFSRHDLPNNGRWFNVLGKIGELADPARHKDTARDR